MIRTEFRDKFPALFDALKTIGLDNNMKLNDEFHVEAMDEDFNAFDAKLKEMNSIDFDTFCVGEYEEVQMLVARYQANELNFFLELIFDGLYNRVFYQD